MPEKKRKLTLIELLVIIAILGILLSILGGTRQTVRQRAERAGRPPAAVQETAPPATGDEGDSYFWRP